MKTLIFTTLLLILVNATALSQWQPIGYQTKGITGFEVDNVGTLHASYSDTVLRSTNGGNSYFIFRIPGAITPAAVFRLLIDRTQTLYISEYHTATLLPRLELGFYKSTNRGVTWDFVRRVFPDQSGACAFYGTTGGAMLLAFNNQILRSTDGGGTWTTVLSMTGSVRPIFRFYENANGVLFAMRSSGGLFRSTNGGTSWTEVPNFTRTIMEMNEYAGIVYAMTLGFGVFRSNDNGQTFVNIGLDGRDAISFTNDANGTIYAACTDGIFASVNFGQTWFNYNTGLPSQFGITAIRCYQNTLYLGTSQGIWKRTDLFKAPFIPEFFTEPFDNGIHPAWSNIRFNGQFNTQFPPASRGQCLSVLLNGSGSHAYLVRNLTPTREVTVQMNINIPLSFTQIRPTSDIMILRRSKNNSHFDADTWAVYLSTEQTNSSSSTVSLVPTIRNNQGNYTRLKNFIIQKDKWINIRMTSIQTSISTRIKVYANNILVDDQLFYQYYGDFEQLLIGLGNSQDELNSSMLMYFDDIEFRNQFDVSILNTPKQVEEINSKNFVLSQNYPNPFNPETTIQYQLPTSGQVTIQLYDPTGRIISKELLGTKTEGFHSYSINASRLGLSSGVYFYEVIFQNPSNQVLNRQIKKMTLVK
ncbi:MAG: T9SS type A sorting domain-containing protein [Chloroherpetonaceae bacterium]|nr:T9SS type A sorting domain-containing protein [Chloroherpetonaceae bacterium]